MSRATPGSPMTADQSNWKPLSELPKLGIPAGEAWERNTVLRTWQKDVVLASTTISVQFSDFVSGMMKAANARYNYKKRTLARCYQSLTQSQNH
eukprot:11167345-Lingulodinium_polyedra.AAC.1